MKIDMDEPKQAKAIAYALGRLKNELSPRLTYHNLWHTEHDVMPSAIQLAWHIGVSEAEMRLLTVAAAFHDIGFVEDPANHELVGTRIAVQALCDIGFTTKEVDTVMGMIIATRLPQSPRSLLEEIIADADLDVLGRQDFLSRSHNLRQELLNFGHETTLKVWYEGQIAFMKNHAYFTAVARMLRDRDKQQNIAKLTDLLASLT